MLKFAQQERKRKGVGIPGAVGSRRRKGADEDLAAGRRAAAVLRVVAQARVPFGSWEMGTGTGK